MNLKKLFIPQSNETREIDVAQLWEVRWQSRHGEYCSDVRPEMETFLTETEACDFKASLENAFELIRHRSGTKITVQKAK